MTTTPPIPDPYSEGAGSILGALRRWATARELAGDHVAARVVIEFLEDLTATYLSLAERVEADAARDARSALRIVRETEPAE